MRALSIILPRSLSSRLVEKEKPIRRSFSTRTLTPTGSEQVKVSTFCSLTSMDRLRDATWNISQPSRERDLRARSVMSAICLKFMIHPYHVRVLGNAGSGPSTGCYYAMLPDSGLFAKNRAAQGSARLFRARGVRCSLIACSRLRRTRKMAGRPRYGHRWPQRRRVNRAEGKSE